jgi:hypothetical protein
LTLVQWHFEDIIDPNIDPVCCGKEERGASNQERTYMVEVY